MTTETTERIWGGLDAAKVIAGTLAAVSAAVLASMLGVAGTLVGAAVASLVGTVGQELYAQSLKRGYRKLRDPTGRRSGVSSAPPGAVPTGDADSPDRAWTTDVRPTATRADTPAAGAVHVPTGADRPSARPRWRRIALAAVAAFAFAMLAVSAFELLSGRALAGMMGDDGAGSTTISSVVDGRDGSAATPAPTTSPSTSPSTDADTEQPTQAPTAAPTDAGESPEPTGTPGNAPTEAPTAEPTGPARDTAPTAPVAPSAGP
jgi:hypothetical protein